MDHFIKQQSEKIIKPHPIELLHEPETLGRNKLEIADFDHFRVFLNPFSRATLVLA